MNKEITLSDLFSSVSSTSEVLDVLKDYQANGIKYLLTYGFKSIETEKLIKYIEMLKNEMQDLEEILKAINYIIHS